MVITEPQEDVKSVANYNFYVLEYCGSKIPEDDFRALAIRAAELVAYFSFGRTKKRSVRREFFDEIMSAECAVAELLYEEQDSKKALSESAVKSESIGDVKIEYRTLGVTMLQMSASIRREIVAVIERHLLFTGVLYAGMCR